MFSKIGICKEFYLCVLFSWLTYICWFWYSLDLNSHIGHFSVSSPIHLTHLHDYLFKMKLTIVWMWLGLFDCCDDIYVSFKVLCLFFSLWLNWGGSLLVAICLVYVGNWESVISGWMNVCYVEFVWSIKVSFVYIHVELLNDF